jgi:hypothetical protein
MTFTVDEIHEWLEGWKCTDGAGNPTPSLSLENILTLLHCEQDGIAGWVERVKGLNCPSCNNEGYYMVCDAIGNPTPEQCEWCYTTPNSKFNMRQ